MAAARGTELRHPILAVIVGSILVLVGSGCGEGSNVTATSSGTARTETRDVRGFDAVELAGAGQLTVQQGTSESLQVTADDDVLPNLTSEVSGSTLRLGVRPGARIPATAKITYAVTASSVERLALSGAGTVSLTGIDGPELAVTQSGAGTVTATGRVQKVVLDLSGAGDFDGRDLASRDADVSIRGATNAVVNASTTLKARIDGAGDVEYLGNPTVTRDGAGPGTITRI